MTMVERSATSEGDASFRRTLAEQRLHFFPNQIENGRREAGAQQPERDRPAHVAQADETKMFR